MDGGVLRGFEESGWAREHKDFIRPHNVQKFPRSGLITAGRLE